MLAAMVHMDQAVEVELCMTCVTEPERHSLGNLIAEVRGRELPDEVRACIGRLKRQNGAYD